MNRLRRRPLTIQYCGIGLNCEQELSVFPAAKPVLSSTLPFQLKPSAKAPHTTTSTPSTTTSATLSKLCPPLRRPRPCPYTTQTRPYSVCVPLCWRRRASSSAGSHSAYVALSKLCPPLRPPPLPLYHANPPLQRPCASTLAASGVVGGGVLLGLRRLRAWGNASCAPRYCSSLVFSGSVTHLVGGRSMLCPRPPRARVPVGLRSARDRLVRTSALAASCALSAVGLRSARDRLVRKRRARLPRPRSYFRTAHASLDAFACLYTGAGGVTRVVSGGVTVRPVPAWVLGMNRGVFEMLDGVGLDVALDIENHYAAVRPGQIPPEPAALLKSMVDVWKLGVKSGSGFYEHPPHAPMAEKDHIVFLDIIKGEVRSLAIDGREGKTLISGLTSRPDGVQIDERPGKGHIYWTNMGTSANDGFLSRANIDGSNMTVIVPPGATHTPKQLVLDTKREHLYWCDREGGKIQRCNLDGSDLTTLYGNSKGSKGRVFRANIDLPAGSNPASREDVEVLFEGLPEPIDLEYHDGCLYWTDRGDPPFGNSLNRADVSAALSPKSIPRGPSSALVIAERFHETIGLAVDPIGKKIYVSDLLGSLWVTNLDGSHKTAILRDAGNFTGITFHPAKSV
ncbi:hypothetical protein C8R45DRAFT_1072595 [Mycena sanguinolenta]|nr:hypothetical protein C8R45DRAFT_1072595 [Mycena sanguinolenta]